MTVGGNNGWQESLVSMLPKPLKIYSNTERPTPPTPIHERFSILVHRNRSMELGCHRFEFIRQ